MLGGRVQSLAPQYQEGQPSNLPAKKSLITFLRPNHAKMAGKRMNRSGY